MAVVAAEGPLVMSLVLLGVLEVHLPRVEALVSNFLVVRHVVVEVSVVAKATEPESSYSPVLIQKAEVRLSWV